jgi:hypothetical protein
MKAIFSLGEGISRITKPEIGNFQENVQKKGGYKRMH